jgi:4'-phosphopantetheinyl transferase
VLAEAEQARLAALKTDKRRHDWLLGRWTAKRLLQACLAQQTGRRIALDALTVGSDPDGAPFVNVDSTVAAAPPPPLPSQWERGAGGEGLPQSLSISHCNGYAFCALSDTAGIRVGADIERIEPRSWQFAEDYFTDEEIMLVRRAPAAERDTLITAIWSAKEAALKALRLGLSVDTRSVACAISLPDRVSDWSRFDIACDQSLLGAPATPELIGWWRRMDDYVLTVAVTDSGSRGFENIDSTDHIVMLNEVKQPAADR